MKINTHGLTLEVVAQETADEEGWCRVHVHALAPGFEGNFDAWLQTCDLDRFGTEIGHLYDAVGQPGTATLASTEPDIEVVLTMGRMGGISGRYRLESERRDGEATVLSGAFEIDQSFLPGLQGSVQALLAELGGVRDA